MQEGLLSGLRSSRIRCSDIAHRQIAIAERRE